MNKILKIIKRKLSCISVRSDADMVNFSQFSPRVTRSRSKKLLKAEAEESKVDDESEKSKNAGKPKGRRKTKKQVEELNSVRASKGSVGTLSLLHTPKKVNEGPAKVRFRSPKTLQPPDNKVSLRSPPIGTISADTPERSEKFHRDIENVSECKLRVLGKGSFGTIIQVTYKGELVAAKIVPPNKINSLRNELNNFLLSHPNIVKTLRIISNEENFSCGLVIMEMGSPFTLDHLTMDESYTLNNPSIVRYMTDVANALDYCHQQRVLHLDVKPKNILVNVKTNVCKLCDFGSSCLLSGEPSGDTSDYKTLRSTVVYTSPELLTGESPTEKSDVYSYGITLWQVVYREKPYVVDNKIDLQSTIYKIMKERKRPKQKGETNEAFEKLYTSCWEHEPEKRPKMTEVLQFLENVRTS